MVARYAKDMFTRIRSLEGTRWGRGLAAMASAVTGAHATTYNAAGVSESTLERAGTSKANAKVDNYRVRGEILTTVQEATPAPNALGQQHTLEPRDSAETLKAGDDGALGISGERHRMGLVLDALAIPRK